MVRRSTDRHKATHDRSRCDRTGGASRACRASRQARALRRRGALFWHLLVRGAVLLMFTLGIYRFWLTTDIRRFLWSNTELAGETLRIYRHRARAPARLPDGDRDPGAALYGVLLHRAQLGADRRGFRIAELRCCWPCSANTPSIGRGAIASPARSIAACGFTRPARRGATRSAAYSGGA